MGEKKPTEHLVPPIHSAATPDEHITTYVTRDLAYRSGITRDHLAELPVDGQAVRRWTGDADVAVRSVLGWIANNAPAAVEPLRAAGLLVYTPDDGFGTSPASPKEA